MTKTTLSICLVLLLSACGEDKTQTDVSTATKDMTENTDHAHNVADKEALVAEAKGAVMALAGSLKKELKGAMSSGGPLAAVDVCVEKAPAIAQQVSEEKNLTVGRVSLKNRNAVNVPNEWQAAVLNDFETRKAGGEAADKLAYAETVEVDGKKEFRFMKAIPTGSLCLTCHDDNVPEAITAKLKENYPEDKAIGYKEGDLRGAFYVLKTIK